MCHVASVQGDPFSFELPPKKSLDHSVRRMVGGLGQSAVCRFARPPTHFESAPM